jgi:hypothetical protein
MVAWARADGQNEPMPDEREFEGPQRVCSMKLFTTLEKLNA